VKPRRVPTSTSSFGVSRRENHDASSFYARFAPPEVNDDNVIARPAAVDAIYCGDARSMTEVADSSVALMVTSPPYFAGKEYEKALGEGHVPASYLEYLQGLEEVFAECVRTLEPGGRLAVNVANLGRKPYRSLASDVVAILQDRLRLLLRGEIVWVKGRGSTGSCAWGSFQLPGNPVLRDLSERVIVASKGRFSRALKPLERQQRGLPWDSSLTRDEFMEATTDVWELPAERATQVGHPAPFPVALPERLIHLFTYRDDLVLDPYMGSGSTAVAAVRTGRHFVGYDTEPEYVATANERVATERARLALPSDGPQEVARAVGSRAAAETEVPTDAVDRAMRAGLAAVEVAKLVLQAAGFHEIAAKPRVAKGVQVSYRALDQRQRPWFFEVVGGYTIGSAGLRSDALWRALGRAAVAREHEPKSQFVILATAPVVVGSPAAAAVLAATGPDRIVADVCVLHDSADRARLAQLAIAGEPDS
jgi:site-specific DNA-methyltransferase (adenine-specific)